MSIAKAFAVLVVAANTETPKDILEAFGLLPADQMPNGASADVHEDGTPARAKIENPKRKFEF